MPCPSYCRNYIPRRLKNTNLKVGRSQPLSFRCSNEKAIPESNFHASNRQYRLTTTLLLLMVAALSKTAFNNATHIKLSSNSTRTLEKRYVLMQFSHLDDLNNVPLDDGHSRVNAYLCYFLFFGDTRILLKIIHKYCRLLLYCREYWESMLSCQGKYQLKEKKAYLWIQWIILLHALRIKCISIALAYVLSRFGKRIPKGYQLINQHSNSYVM